MLGVHYSPQGSAVTQGQHMLENYLQGVQSSMTIFGSSESTDIESLQPALSQIVLTPVNIPPLQQNLITSATLTFPTDIVQTGIASSKFVLANPFTAAVNLLKMDVTVMYQNFKLGAINVDRSSDPIHADGHTNITSDTLPLNFNLDPVTIIDLLLALSKANNVNFGPLSDLFDIVLQNPDQGKDVSQLCYSRSLSLTNL